MEKHRIRSRTRTPEEDEEEENGGSSKRDIAEAKSRKRDVVEVKSKRMAKDGSESEPESQDRSRRKEEGSRYSSRSRKKRSRSSKRRSRRKHSNDDDSHSSSSDSDDSSSDSESESDGSDYASESEEERRRRKRKERKRREEREREKRRMRKEKEKKRRKKDGDGDKKKKKKEKEKKKDKDKGKKGAVTDSWGKYGIIRETDMWNKRPEFTAWLGEVKKVNLESLANWEEKQMFKDFMEDHNTGTFPSKKYYGLDAYFKRQMEKDLKKGFKKVLDAERTVFNDEEQRRQELMLEREKHKEEQVEALKVSMQSGMAQAMKEQAQLREEMAYQYKLGNFEAAAAIQRRLDPDVAM